MSEREREMLEMAAKAAGYARMIYRDGSRCDRAGREGATRAHV